MDMSFCDYEISRYTYSVYLHGHFKDLFQNQ